ASGRGAVLGRRDDRIWSSGRACVREEMTAKLKIAWVGKTKEPAIARLTDEYLKRISLYSPVEGISLRDEADLLAKFGPSAKTKSTLILLDSRGKEFSSEQFAKFLGDYQERNPLPLVLAIGGADGFGAEARPGAQHIISLGKMT